MKDKEKSKNIVILVDCLSHGGAEKSATILSKLLDAIGYTVYIIPLRHEIGYDYKGQLVNLNVKSSGLKIVDQFRKVLKLSKNIKAINPDYIIDYRMRHLRVKEYVMHKLIFDKCKMVFTVHNYFIDYHLPKGDVFKESYNNHIVTAVSKEIKQLLEDDYGINNVHYLPNPVDRVNIEELALKDTINESYIIAVGRLANSVKQFDKLIEVYSASGLQNKNIKLKILGDGPDKKELQQLITRLNLGRYVELMGFKANPYPYIKSAKFLVLCSKHEGLPMVILEALTLKTPVVSFNCKSGPSEMIKNNSNGILIEDQNFEVLKESIIKLGNDEALLKKLKMNSNKFLSDYSENAHIERWKKILK